jgi:hypothetical protein
MLANYSISVGTVLALLVLVAALVLYLLGRITPETAGLVGALALARLT